MQEQVQDMNTQQIQEEQNKEYSFEEICPDWNRILSENGGFIENRGDKFEASDGDQRTIMACNSCIVGEAHGGY
jgi:hypothetical protein